jgi:hypothetical protein
MPEFDPKIIPVNPFLKQVAEYLYTRHLDELSDFCIVFPGRRAGVFFTAYLNELVESSMLSPEVITINELIYRLTDLREADPVSLVIKLHEIYTSVTGLHEPLDEFFFWGEILLGDFDDVDKYLLDANDLFRNIADLKELENQFDYLTREQKRALEEFWGNLEKAPGSLNKEKFMDIWEKLAEIYHRYKEALKQNDQAFPGMIYREVAENSNKNLLNELSAEKYVFVGFNALNNCEKTIFSKLNNQKKALFFWDYADFYLNNAGNEAGRFLRTNRVMFPAPKDFVIEENDQSQRKIQFVAVPGNLTQSQAINLPQVLQSFDIENRFDNTAFVLSDESLLIPVISSVGNHFQDINITMGYPFINTPVYGFVSQLISLLKNTRRSTKATFHYYKPVIALLNHPFVIDDEIRQFVSEIHRRNKVYINSVELHFNPLVSRVFSNPETWYGILDYFLDILKELSVKFKPSEDKPYLLESEYLYQAYLGIQRLKDSLGTLHIPDFPVKILLRLLDQAMRRISIPFEGEPLSGLQIMGLLETRCLDFENLVLFSANEGFLPRIAASHSFIPYHLRKGFGMPTYEDRDAMYAYYFYRLIHRNKRTVIVYNSITEGISFAEKSRYLFQLQYDSDFKIEETKLNFNFKGTTQNSISIHSNQAYVDQLITMYSENRLSPSAINTWLDCKLEFYFKYLAGIKEKEELKEEIDAVLFGNLFHYAMEQLYRPLVGRTVEDHMLKLLAADKRNIDEKILEAIAVKYFGMRPEESASLKLSGQNVLIAAHIREYIVQLIENDRAFIPFEMIALEKNYIEEFEVQSDHQKIKVKVGGIVDRIDRTGDGLRIVDYKTGHRLKIDFKEWWQLTDRNYADRRKEIFQTLIYSDILSRTESQSIFPAIYKLDNFFEEEFHPNVVFRGEKLVYQQVQTEFRETFAAVLIEIFNTQTIFDQVTNAEKCGYCPYNRICKR